MKAQAQQFSVVQKQCGMWLYRIHTLINMFRKRRNAVFKTAVTTTEHLPDASPGVLYEVDQRPATAPAGPLHTFTDAAQISLPTWALSKWCPTVVVSLLAIRQLGSFTVGLADVADVIVGNLTAGKFSKKRVGLKRDPTSA